MTDFNPGDRVTTVTDDDYNGLTGSVVEKFVSSWRVVDYTVLLDGKTNALSFSADELRPAEETDLRLTIKSAKLPKFLMPGVGQKYEYVFEGDYTIEVEEIPVTKYVQVQYAGKFSAKYTYVDPSGNLAVGDEVIVPVTYGEKPGTVVALGRGTWGGECKTVTCRVVREAL